ncbi:MAG: DUF4331 domain-containing protein [Aestuariibacter sp.]
MQKFSGKRLLLASSIMSVLSIGAASASSHREAPYISKYPQVDASDFYMFNSYEPGREGYVTILANYIPVQAAYGGPNYFPLDENALYEIHIDNDGDAIEDLTFQFHFDNSLPENGVVSFEIGEGDNKKSIPAVLRNVGGISPDAASGLNYMESYNLNLVTGDRRTGTSAEVINAATNTTKFRKPFDYSGTKTFGGAGNYGTYADSFIYPINIPECEQPGKVFVGQRAEAFKIALGEVFDLVNFVPVEGDSTPGANDGGGFPGGVTQDESRNILAKNNVTTIALELPAACLTGEGNGVIGGWTTASLRQATILNPVPTLDKPEVSGGAWTQVSRLGNFLVNELFIGFPDKDKFNASEPKDDAQFANYVTHPVFPAIVDILFKDAVNSTLGTEIPNLAPTNIPRLDLVTGFLTGFENLNQLEQATPSEVLRLNTGITATPREAQHYLGVAAGDVAGFPNGRRPGDDSVDIALRVAMGALCHPVPLGEDGAAINLGLCEESQAPIGNVPLTDGAPISAMHFNNRFPYLLTPYPGSPGNSPVPQPEE